MFFSVIKDRRNFVRAPPAGVDFEFNYDTVYPTAVAIMAEDTALEKMRFDLVPKIITEENFWRNYFYRVSLICQASDLGTLGAPESDENEGELIYLPFFLSILLFYLNERGDWNEIYSHFPKPSIDF